MPEITFTCSDEDAAWLAEQAEQLGIDDIGITVRVVVRNARQRNQSFGIVANGDDARLALAQHYPHRPSSATVHVNPAFEAQGAPVENPPAPELPDEVEAALADAAETIPKAQLTETRVAPIAMAQPSSSYRSRAATLRNQPALRVLDGPGSRTQVVGAGELLSADPRTLPADQRIVAQNLRGQMDRHFGGLRRG
jgi:hypothetical protein